MAFSRNDSKNDDGFFVEFKDDFEDLTRQTLTLSSHTNDQQSRENTDETCNVKIIKVKGNKIDIVVSECSVAQFGSDTKAVQVQSCKLCSKNCYTSSDEESEAAVPFKISEVQEDSQAHVSTLIYSPMPVIPKRGCMTTSQYSSTMAKLNEQRSTGDFDGHEQLFKTRMAKLKSAPDFDMEMTLQIEKGMALYFQNNIKDAKKILKIVVKQEKQLKNPGILVGRALNLLTAVYKRQKKFGNAMECVERARACLEGQDSADDKAELHHSYGALITALPAAKEPETVQATKEEAYNSYQRAADYNGIKYVRVKMAALLLESRSRGEMTVHLPRKAREDLMKAKKHLDFVESKLADNESLGTRIKCFVLQSDVYRYQHNVPMAMKKAQKAMALIEEHGFDLERAGAQSRIDHLSTMKRQESEEWGETEFSSSSSTSGLAESESAHSDKFGIESCAGFRSQLFPLTDTNH